MVAVCPATMDHLWLLQPSKLSHHPGCCNQTFSSMRTGLLPSVSVSPWVLFSVLFFPHLYTYYLIIALKFFTLNFPSVEITEYSDWMELSSERKVSQGPRCAFALVKSSGQTVCFTSLNSPQNVDPYVTKSYLLMYGRMHEQINYLNYD